MLAKALDLIRASLYATTRNRGPQLWFLRYHMQWPDSFSKMVQAGASL